MLVETTACQSLHVFLRHSVDKLHTVYLYFYKPKL